MEPGDVQRSLGVSLSAPNLNLKQETRHYGSLLVLVHPHQSTAGRETRSQPFRGPAPCVEDLIPVANMMYF